LLAGTAPARRGPPPGVLVGASGWLSPPSSLTTGGGALSQAATADTAIKNPQRTREANGPWAETVSTQPESAAATSCPLSMLSPLNAAKLSHCTRLVASLQRLQPKPVPGAAERVAQAP